MPATKVWLVSMPLISPRCRRRRWRKTSRVSFGIGGIRPQAGKGRDLVQIVGQVDLAHVLGVVVAQLHAVGQVEHQHVALAVAGKGLAIAEAPGQHGVDDQGGSIVEGQEQELAPAERRR